MAQLKLFYPIKPWTVWQVFGVNGEWYRANGINIQGHNGLDIAAYDGQAVYAAHDGQVVFTGEDGKGGLGIVLRTNLPYDYKDGEAYFKTIYWHLKPNTFKVKPGDFVKAGTQIACADNTGFSTATHLHFGLKPIQKGEDDWQWYNLEPNNGYLGCIDPTPYFDKFYAQDISQVISILQKIRDALQTLVDIKNIKKRLI